MELNQELIDYCDENTYITNEKLEELATEDELEVIKEGLKGATISERGIPTIDILSIRRRGVHRWMN